MVKTVLTSFSISGTNKGLFVVLLFWSFSSGISLVCKVETTFTVGSALGKSKLTGSLGSLG